MSYFFLLHLIVFIFGFTGILGKLITIPSLDLVFYRVLIASVTIGLFLAIKKRSIKVDLRTLGTLLMVGALAMGHWVTFFHAIKISNVSVTLACISSASLFTAFLEPIFFKKKLDTSEIVMGVVIIIGITIITNAQFEYIDGILMALLSAFLGSVFGVWNGLLIRTKSSLIISFYELAGGAVMLAVLYVIIGYDMLMPSDISNENWMYLGILGTVATAFAFVVSVYVMKELSPFTVVLAINLEPVYAIIMAWLLFDETMNDGFYIGAVLIIGTLVVNGYMKNRRNKRHSMVKSNVQV